MPVHIGKQYLGYHIILDYQDYGMGWSLSGNNLVFTPTASGKTYTITQIDPNTRLNRNITFPTGINDVTVMIDDINITGNMTLQNGNDATAIINDIRINGNIVLQGDAELDLLLNGTNTIVAGIHAPEGTALTIDSVDSTLADPGSTNGSLLIINPAQYNAGIGGGYNENGGTITINGGTVTIAFSSSDFLSDGGAGIGGGYRGNGGNIIINDGIVAITGSRYYGAGIGGGDGGGGGNITINGGTVDALGSGAGIGGGNNGSSGNITINGGTVTATANYLSSSGAGIGGGYGGNGNNITINDGIVTAIGGRGGSGIGSGYGGTSENITINGGTVTANGGGSDLFSRVIGGAGIGSGSGNDSDNITINGGIVTAIGVYSAAGIGGGYEGAGGNITINDGIVNARGAGAGIGSGNKDSGSVNNIIITGGTVTAIGSAGIGSGQNGNGGNVTITGGMVDATGTSYGAGIGGSNGGSGDNVTITGGIVNAIGGSAGAGIGGGRGGNGGNVTINDGTITAAGGFSGAGIGGGYGGNGGNVTINDGMITAASTIGAGIGIGQDGNGGNITINGGTVTAIGNQSAGIGGGNNSSGGNITINGGIVTATSGGYSYGAGIGSGSNSNGGNITISDGMITATSIYGAGVGIGYGSNDGNIMIAGGTVTATSQEGAGIGNGLVGTGGNITISDGMITATSTNGAGIGGGNGSTTLPTLNISSAADITAFSRTKPAINVSGNNLGDGFYVNAQFSSQMSNTILDVYASDDPITVLRSLHLPNGYRSFAYTTGATSTQIDHIVADVPTRVYAGHVLQDGGLNDGSQDIPSQNTNVPLPVRLGTPMFTVSGIVTVNGNPLKDVAIEYSIGGSTETVTTDPDGYYEILSLPYGALFEITGVTKAGYAVVETMPAAFIIDDDDEFDFTMSVTSTATHTVSGNVTVGSYPLGSATVSYTIGTGAVQTAMTDPDGYYEILNVPFGHLFEITSVTKTGYAVVEEMPAAVIIEDDEEFDFTMSSTSTATHTVSGNVTVNGNLLEGVTVSYKITGAAQTVTTDSDGYYEILNVPFGSSFEIIGVTKTGYAVVETLPAFVIEDDEDFDFTMSVTSTATPTVSGNVTVNGNLLEGVTVSYRVGTGAIQTAATDADGYYEILNVPFGSLFEITGVAKTGYAVVEAMPAAFIIENDEAFDFTVSVTSTATHTVSGDVTVNGYPLPGVTVSYKVGTGAVQTAMTDSDGYYEILNVPFGSLFEITDVTKTGYEVAEAMPAAFIIEDNEDFDFTMYVMSMAIHTVSGHVTVDGFSLKEVTVAYTIDGASGYVETNDSGYYQILNVPFGSYFVITDVTKTGYLVNENLPTDGVIVESNRVFDFTMDATAATTYDVSGYVMEGNSPLENVTISFTIGTGAVQTVTTDSNGYYEILNIPFGSPLQITGVTKSDYQVNENIPTNVVIIEDDEDFDFTMSVGSTSGGSGGSGSGNATVIPNRPVIPEPPEIPPEEIPPEEIPPEEIPGGEPGEGGGSGGGGSERPLESNAQTYIVTILIILAGVFLFAYRRRSEMKR